MGGIWIESLTLSTQTWMQRRSLKVSRERVGGDRWRCYDSGRESEASTRLGTSFSLFLFLGRQDVLETKMVRLRCMCIWKKLMWMEQEKKKGWEGSFWMYWGSYRGGMRDVYRENANVNDGGGGGERGRRVGFWVYWGRTCWGFQNLAWWR